MNPGTELVDPGTQLIQHESPNGVRWDIMDTLGITWKRELFRLLDYFSLRGNKPGVHYFDGAKCDFRLKSITVGNGEFGAKLEAVVCTEEGYWVKSALVIIEVDHDTPVYAVMVVL